jgi:structural maintenance of chromosome 3 (chondroitin sulfate proteoglycan 6)
VDEKSVLIARLEQEVAAEEARIATLTHDSGDIRARAEEQQSLVAQLDRERFDMQRRKDELQTRRNELWREQIKLEQEVSGARDELAKTEQALRSVTGRPVLQGIESIRHILEQAENADLAAGYHGLLVDNIECERSLFTAVEQSVSNRLFYHIVETDNVAMRLLKQMNQQKLNGEVNYLPLNVLRSGDRNEETGYVPDVNEAISLIKKITYEKKVCFILLRANGKSK